MKLALKKTPRPGLFGPLSHRVACHLDHSPYSHGELVFKTGKSASSVIGEGVRFKDIKYSSGAWDFFTLPDELEPAAHAWFMRHVGAPYDHMGMFRFGFGVLPQSPTRWFCTEAISASLGWSKPHIYGPDGVRARCVDIYGSVMVDTPWPTYEVHPAFKVA